MRALSFVISCAVLCSWKSAWAVELEEDTGASSTEAVALAEESPKTPETHRETLIEERKLGKQSLRLGAPDEAYEHFALAIEACAALGKEECSKKARAVLFVELGVSLAMQDGKHGSAVQVFRRAIKYDGKVQLPEEFSSRQVRRAFLDAKGQRLADDSEGRASGGTASARAETSAEKTLYLGLQGGGGFATTIGPYSVSTASFFAAGSLGFSPRNSPLVLGGRVRVGGFGSGGAYVQPGFEIGFVSNKGDNSFVFLTSPGFVASSLYPLVYAHDTRIGGTVGAFYFGAGVNVFASPLVAVCLEAHLGLLSFH